MLIPDAYVLARLVGLDVDSLEVARDALVACRLLRANRDPDSAVYVLQPIVPHKDDRLPMFEVLVSAYEQHVPPHSGAWAISVRAPKDLPAWARFQLVPPARAKPLRRPVTPRRRINFDKPVTLRDKLLARFDAARNEQEMLSPVLEAWRAMFRPPTRLAVVVTAMQKLGGGRPVIERLLPEFPKFAEHWLARQEKTLGDGVRTCKRCGRTLVWRYGRFGPFRACPGYPECRVEKKVAKQPWR